MVGREGAKGKRARSRLGPSTSYREETRTILGAFLGPFFAVNRSFFVSLFFFISGFFVVGVFERHSPRAFVRGRLGGAHRSRDSKGLRRSGYRNRFYFNSFTAFSRVSTNNTFPVRLLS